MGAKGRIEHGQQGREKIRTKEPDGLYLERGEGAVFLDLSVKTRGRGNLGNWVKKKKSNRVGRAAAGNFGDGGGWKVSERAQSDRRYNEQMGFRSDAPIILNNPTSS